MSGSLERQGSRQLTVAERVRIIESREKKNEEATNAQAQHFSTHFVVVAVVFVLLQLMIFGLSIWAYVVEQNQAASTGDKVGSKYSLTLAVATICAFGVMVQFSAVGFACMRPVREDRINTRKEQYRIKIRDKFGLGMALSTYVIATGTLCFCYSMLRYIAFDTPDGLYFTDLGFSTVLDLLFISMILGMTCCGRVLMGEERGEALELSAAVLGDVVDVVDLSFYIYQPNPINLNIAIKVFNFAFIAAFGLYPIAEKFYKSKWYMRHFSQYNITSSMLWCMVKIGWTHFPFIIMRSLLVTAFEQSSVNAIFIFKNVFEIIVLSRTFVLEYRKVKAERKDMLAMQASRLSSHSVTVEMSTMESKVDTLKPEVSTDLSLGAVDSFGGVNSTFNLVPMDNKDDEDFSSV